MLVSLRCESLEARDVPALFATGSGPGDLPVVRIFEGETGRLLSEFPVLTPSVTGGVRVALADMNGDEKVDVVVGSGPGGGSVIRLYDLAGQSLGGPLDGLSPFESTFQGGVYVSAGDLNGDGRDDLVVSPDEGGGPRVRVLDGKTGDIVADFFGIEDPGFRGGARTAVGDVNGDGRADLVVAAGFGGGPRIAVFDGMTLAPAATPTRVVADFFAFEESLRNGAYPAAGDVDADGFADLVFGAGPGGGPRVRVASGAHLVSTGAAEGGFLVDTFAGSPDARDGVRVAVSDTDGNGTADIVASAGTGLTRPRVLSGTNGAVVLAEWSGSPASAGGTFVAGSSVTDGPVGTEGSPTGVFNAYDFGARPGSRNATPGIQAAIDAAAAAGGGTVVIDAVGTYNLRSAGANPYDAGHQFSLNITGDNITFTVGPGVTLQLADGQQTNATGPVDLIIFQARKNLTFTGGGRIVGNTAGQPGWTLGENGTPYGQVTRGCIIYGYTAPNGAISDGIVVSDLELSDHFSNPVNIDGATNVRLENLMARNCGEGFQVIDATNVICSNLTYLDTTESGVTQGDAFELSRSVGAVVTNLIVRGPIGGTGIDLFGSRSVAVSGFFVEGATAGFEAIPFYAGGVNSGDIVVSNGVFSKIKGTGAVYAHAGSGSLSFSNIEIRDSAGLSVQLYGTAADGLVTFDNLIADANQQGFYIFGSRRVNIQGGSLTNTKADVGALRVIRTDLNASPNLTINGLRANGNTGWGIVVDGQAGSGPEFQPVGSITNCDLRDNANGAFMALNFGSLKRMTILNCSPTYAPTYLQLAGYQFLGEPTHTLIYILPEGHLDQRLTIKMPRTPGTTPRTLFDFTQSPDGNIHLASGTSITLQPGHTLTLDYDVATNAWYEVQRTTLA